MSSATGGYLVPTDNPIYDAALDDFFGNVLAELSELDRDNNIRPLFQEDPPALPEHSEDWLAFGVTVTEAENGVPELIVNEPGDTDSKVTVHEKIEVSLQVYGPNTYTIIKSQKTRTRVKLEALH